MTPDWDKINREISESMGVPVPDVENKRLHPYDWREPAAAMKLFRRLKAPRLEFFPDARCYSIWDDWLKPFGPAPTEWPLDASTPEEAIVLAYHASLKAKT